MKIITRLFGRYLLEVQNQVQHSFEDFGEGKGGL